MEIRSNCDVVRDLLPLYVDDVCTPSSRAFVTEHLNACGECSALERKLRDTKYESLVSAEAQDVLTRHAKKEKGAARRAGMIMAALLAFPILICAIVTAAGESDFGSLLIVIASMMIPASFILVPLFSKKDRFLRIVTSFTASLMLVLFFVCLQEGQSFAGAAIPTVFGLSVAFLPFIIRGIPLPESLKDKKAITVISWDCIWLFLTIIVGNMPEMKAASMREGMVVSAFLLIVTLTVYGVVKLSNTSVNTITKTAVVILILGLWVSFINEITRLFKEGTLGMITSIFDPSTWSLGVVFSSIVLTILGTLILLISVIAIIWVVQSIVEEQ